MEPEMNHLKIGVVSYMNMDRSIEAHAMLRHKGFEVLSYGTADKIVIPGVTPDEPNEYNFATPYEVMYQDLVDKDRDYYAQEGILQMLERNKRVKLAPQRFQLTDERFDIIVTCEERVYDQVVEVVSSRPVLDVGDRKVYIVGVDIDDNHSAAIGGAFFIHDLVRTMCWAPWLTYQIDDIVVDYEERNGQPLKNCVMYN